MCLTRILGGSFWKRAEEVENPEVVDATLTSPTLVVERLEVVDATLTLEDELMVVGASIAFLEAVVLLVLWLLVPPTTVPAEVIRSVFPMLRKGDC